MDKLSAALNRVEKMLGSVKPTKRVAKPSKKKAVKASTEVVATFETWEAAHRVLAAFKPNLQKLQKLIKRGLITPQEVSDAMVEALRGKGVSLHLVLAIKDVLVEALGGDLGEVIDVEPGVGMESGEPSEAFPPGM